MNERVRCEFLIISAEGQAIDHAAMHAKSDDAPSILIHKRPTPSTFVENRVWSEFRFADELALTVRHVSEGDGNAGASTKQHACVRNLLSIGRDHTAAAAAKVSLDHGPGFIDGQHSPIQFGTA